MLADLACRPYLQMYHVLYTVAILVQFCPGRSVAAAACGLNGEFRLQVAGSMAEEGRAEAVAASQG